MRSLPAAPGRDDDRTGAVRADLPSRVIAAVGLVASLVAGFGVIDLVTALAPGPAWESLRMLEAGWGIVFGVLLPIALAVQIRRGGGPVAAVQQLVVVTASLALATLLTTTGAGMGPGAGGGRVHGRRGRPPPRAVAGIQGRRRTRPNARRACGARGGAGRHLRRGHGRESPRRACRRHHARVRALDSAERPPDMPGPPDRVGCAAHRRLARPGRVGRGGQRHPRRRGDPCRRCPRRLRDRLAIATIAWGVVAGLIAVKPAPASGSRTDAADPGAR